MRSIIDELCYGNICANEDSCETSREAKALMSYIAEHQDKLLGMLDEEQGMLFEKYNDCYTELVSENEREIFAYAFKLGARLVIEVMEFKIS